MRRILPTIVATLTGHSRQQVIAGVDFQWSRKSWVHNTFRVYELIVWRREGIRTESLLKDGREYSYTWESFFAILESAVRAYLSGLPRLKLVYVPQLQFAGLPLDLRGQSPFRFAIARDNASQSTKSSTGVSSVTLSKTNTGSNLALLSGFEVIGTSVTAVYAAVSMTQLDTVVDPAFITAVNYMYGLLSPATGANNLVLSRAGTTDAFYYQAVSYSGVRQSGLPDAITANNQTGGTTYTQTVTTTVSNAVVVALGYTESTLTAGTGATAYSTPGAGASGTNMFESTTFPIASPSSYSMTIGGATSFAMIMVSLAPVASAAVVHSLMSMGMGS
jgi:hypothetical protein